MRVGGGGFNVSGNTRGSRAGTTSNTGLGSIGGRGVVGVKPEHVGCVIVPDREDEDNTPT